MAKWTLSQLRICRPPSSPSLRKKSKRLRNLLKPIKNNFMIFVIFIFWSMIDLVFKYSENLQKQNNKVETKKIPKWSSTNKIQKWLLTKLAKPPRTEGLRGAPPSWPNFLCTDFDFFLHTFQMILSKNKIPTFIF